MIDTCARVEVKYTVILAIVRPTLSLYNESLWVSPEHVDAAITAHEEVLAMAVNNARGGHVYEQRLATTGASNRLIAHIR